MTSHNHEKIFIEENALVKENTSLESFLHYFTKNKEMTNKEDSVWENRFISILTLSGAIIPLFILPFYTFNIENFLGFTALGAITGLAVSMLIAGISNTTFKLPFRKKLKNLEKEKDIQIKLLSKMFADKDFQKEVITKLTTLENSKYINNSDQIFIKELKMNIAEQLQSQIYIGAACFIELNSSYLENLISQNKQLVDQENKVSDYLQQFEEHDVEKHLVSKGNASQQLNYQELNYRQSV